VKKVTKKERELAVALARDLQGSLTQAHEKYLCLVEAWDEYVEVACQTIDDSEALEAHVQSVADRTDNPQWHTAVQAFPGSSDAKLPLFVYPLTLASEVLTALSLGE
jgi:hypothetical protein